ncbi:DUF3043 domain-containing protein [Cellulomonas citrea]|uniref:DUF3043 domain-containing protein n=1 Tax=Cellulomonas citrea TaxID=1909423 RepID=UPI00135966E1|nr:DUF3043 domain-containing protein [Cellulomonas citrea]
MFGREKTPQPPPASAPDEPSSSGKGRPTPTRKEAEAANKRPLVPTDRKAAGKDARAAARVQRDREYQAMLAGDVKNMPLQHRGPVRTFIRDYVDARRNLGDYFLPVMFALLLVGMALTGPLVSRFGATGSVVAFAFYGLAYLYMFAAIVDGWLLWRRLKRVLVAKFGTEASQARGLGMYLTARVFQLRRLRMPKPRVSRGQYPV